MLTTPGRLTQRGAGAMHCIDLWGKGSPTLWTVFILRPCLSGSLATDSSELWLWPCAGSVEVREQLVLFQAEDPVGIKTCPIKSWPMASSTSRGKNGHNKSELLQTRGPTTAPLSSWLCCSKGQGHQGSMQRGAGTAVPRARTITRNHWIPHAFPSPAISSPYSGQPGDNALDFSSVSTFWVFTFLSHLRNLAWKRMCPSTSDLSH